MNIIFLLRFQLFILFFCFFGCIVSEELLSEEKLKEYMHKLKKKAPDLVRDNVDDVSKGIVQIFEQKVVEEGARRGSDIAIAGVDISRAGVEAAGAAAVVAVSAPILYSVLGDEIGGLSKIGFINYTNGPIELKNFVHRKGENIKDFDHLKVPVEGVMVPKEKGVKIGEVNRGVGSSDQTYAFDIILPEQIGKEVVGIDLFEGAVRVEHRFFHSNIDYSADTDPDTPITPESDIAWYSAENKNIWHKKVGNKIYELSYEVIAEGNDSIMFILTEK